MNADPEGGGLLAWILGVISIVGALYATGRRIFSTVTRSELQNIMKAQDEKFLEALAMERAAFNKALEQLDRQQERMHRENRETNTSVFERISDVEQGVSRIEGQLTGQFKRPERR